MTTPDPVGAVEAQIREHEDQEACWRDEAGEPDHADYHARMAANLRAVLPALREKLEQGHRDLIEKCDMQGEWASYTAHHNETVKALRAQVAALEEAKENLVGQTNRFSERIAALTEGRPSFEEMESRAAGQVDAMRRERDEAWAANAKAAMFHAAGDHEQVRLLLCDRNARANASEALRARLAAADGLADAVEARRGCAYRSMAHIRANERETAALRAYRESGEGA